MMNIFRLVKHSVVFFAFAAFFWKHVVCSEVDDAIGTTRNDTIYPSSFPTSSPTPSGSAGYEWWYLTTSTCLLWGISPTESNAHAIQYAFEFVLSDNLADDEKSSTVILTSYVGVDELMEDDYSFATRLRTKDNHRFLSRSSYKALLLSQDDANPSRLDDTNERGYVEVSVRAWTLSADAAKRVEDSLRETESEPIWIIEPLKEKGVHNVQHVLITDILTELTRIGPPLSVTASPARISLIIVGTIVFFAVGITTVGFVISFSKKHLPTLRERAVAVMAASSPNKLLTSVRHSQGFELARSDDEDTVVETEFSTSRNGNDVAVADGSGGIGGIGGNDEQPEER